MITVINYGCGNIKAIQNVFHKLSVKSTVASCKDDLNHVDKLILPGVGAFDFAMQKLNDSGMKDRLDELVLQMNIPVLGICVGVQLMTQASEEGKLPGLGWIGATVKRFDDNKSDKPVNLPHMGWNDVTPSRRTELFTGLEQGAKFYFLHSYYLLCHEDGLPIAVSDYAGEFVCGVNKDNVYGVQFHPEKSHRFGALLLENFAKMKAC
jgi:glutamine amidotransferase